LDEKVTRDDYVTEDNLKDLKHQINKLQEAVGNESIAREVRKCFNRNIKELL